MLERLLQDICTAAGWSYHDDRAEVPLDGGRRQTVAHATFTADGEELVRLYSVIGSAAALNQNRLLAALRLNANMRFGALAVVGDELAIVDTFLIREADADALRASIEYLARTADRYEQAIYGTDTH